MASITVGTNVKQINYNGGTDNVKQLKYNSSIVWCHPYTLSITNTSYGTVNRTSTSQPNATTGTLTNGATIYYDDVLTATPITDTAQYDYSVTPTSVTVRDNTSFTFSRTLRSYAVTVTCNTTSVESFTYNGTTYTAASITNLGTFTYGTSITITYVGKSGYAGGSTTQTVTGTTTINLDATPTYTLSLSEYIGASYGGYYTTQSGSTTATSITNVVSGTTVTISAVSGNGSTSTTSGYAYFKITAYTRSTTATSNTTVTRYYRTTSHSSSFYYVLTNIYSTTGTSGSYNSDAKSFTISQDTSIYSSVTRNSHQVTTSTLRGRYTASNGCTGGTLSYSINGAYQSLILTTSYQSVNADVGTSYSATPTISTGYYGAVVSETKSSKVDSVTVTGSGTYTPTISSVGNNSITIQAPSCGFTSLIYRSNGTSTGVTVASNSTATVTGLSSGTSYTFYLVPYNTTTYVGRSSNVTGTTSGGAKLTAPKFYESPTLEGHNDQVDFYIQNTNNVTVTCHIDWYVEDTSESNSGSDTIAIGAGGSIVYPVYSTDEWVEIITARIQCYFSASGYTNSDTRAASYQS